MKLVYILLLQLFFTGAIIGQNVRIETTFFNDGELLDKAGPDGQRYTKFKRDEKCIVLEYLGRNHFKVEYKRWTGYVMYSDLSINDEISSLIKEYERVEEEKKLTQKVKEDSIALQKQLGYEKRVEELRNKQRVRDSLSIIQKRQNDSIALYDLRNNCHYMRNEIDEYDHIKVIITDYYTVATNYFEIQLRKYGNQKFVVLHYLDDLGCTSPYSNDRSFAKIKLENNKIITFYHSGDVDCGSFNLLGRLTNSEAVELSKSKIKSIRIQGTEHYEDFNAILYKEFFIDKLKCLDD